jgi:hypothetical protein
MLQSTEKGAREFSQSVKMVCDTVASASVSRYLALSDDANKAIKIPTSIVRNRKQRHSFNRVFDGRPESLRRRETAFRES